MAISHWIKRVGNWLVNYLRAVLHRPHVLGCLKFPTSGRIFQHRSHLVPTDFLKSTAAPSISLDLNASLGGFAEVSFISEVIQISLKGTDSRTESASVSCT